MVKFVRRLIGMPIVLMLLIGAALYFTNPDKRGFVEYMTSELREGSGSTDSTLVTLGRKLVEGAAEVNVEKNSERRNGWVFSIYTYTPPLTDDDGALRYLGIATKFIELSE